MNCFLQRLYSVRFFFLEGKQNLVPTASGRSQLRLPASCTMSYDVFPASGAATQRSRFDFEDDTVGRDCVGQIEYFLLDGFQEG